ncbi:hypothetical protein AAE478_001655 [Parahypoxylon ruwenzoriense]
MAGYVITKPEAVIFLKPKLTPAENTATAGDRGDRSLPQTTIISTGPDNRSIANQIISLSSDFAFRK